jgi:ElaB/YqjD/DUF883 family membrane-anchored ribosome-binding protein
VNTIKETVRGLGDRADVIKDRMKGVKDSVVSTSSSAADRVIAFVKEHPIAAIGIAVGVGYLAIRIARR